MNLEEFRAEFPATRRYAWLDTPGSPPGARSVLRALRRVLDKSEDGTENWLDWDRYADQARALFANWVGADPAQIATVGSLAEAAATVAKYRADGTVLLGADEFQSLLYPFLAEARRDSGKSVQLVRPREGQSRTEALLNSIVPGISLVAVSETTTLDGERIDLRQIRRRTNEIGARLFVNGTQSLGVLDLDLAELQPDYYAVHGYKWMLSPRGAAWLYASPTVSRELGSIAPSWKTHVIRGSLFGGEPDEHGTMARCDTSQAWWSWVGAEAALQLLARLDSAEVETHALRLADRFESEAMELGCKVVRAGRGSHIRVMSVPQADTVIREMNRANVAVKVSENRIRIGVHAFNNDADITRAIEALNSSL